MRLSTLSITLVSVLLGSCQTVPQDFPRLSLAESILRPYPGHEGKLTNKGYVTQADGSKVYEIVDYDLTNKETRLKLRELKFMCNVNGELYRVAQELPGLIQETHKKDCFLLFCGKEQEVQINYKDIVKDYQFLLDANAYCLNIDKYPIGIGGF